MKKQLISTLLISTLAYSIQTSAQISSGGFPLSTQQKTEATIKTNTYNIEQSWEAAQETYYKSNYNKPVLIAQNIPINISFPESGTFTYTPDGQVIWQTKITIPSAPAIGFYYDKFHLPKGANYYIKSDNNKQILGAFTHENNAIDSLFATEATLGSSAVLEINFSNQIDINEIQLIIHTASVYHLGISHLKEYLTDAERILITGTDPDPYNLEGSSSHCMINAACPQGNDYMLSRRSTVQILSENGNGVSACSGTIVNNTQNTTANCKPYLFYASHCELPSSESDAAFSRTQIRFNFENDNCTGGARAGQNTIVGMNYKSRSVLTQQMLDNVNLIQEDFILLEFRQSIPAAYNAIMSGWDISNIPTTAPSGKKFIGFHHPNADVKKLSHSNAILQNGRFFQKKMNSNATEGGASIGSSGSGVFLEDGYVLGTASTAGNPISACGGVDLTIPGKFFLSEINYYKFNSAWNYNTAPNRQLQAHLAPNAPTTTRINPVTTQCTPINGSTSVTKINTLENNINIYPIPSNNGTINIQFNLEEKQDLNVTIYDLTGKKLYDRALNNIVNNTITLDISDLNNGIYLIKINNGFESYMKKITIQN